MYAGGVNPSILWPQPGDREPAPDVALHLLQDFVNTNDVEGDDDGLGSPELLRDWLAERSLLDRSAGVPEPAWRRAIDIREGLRALGRVNNGEPLDAAQLAAMNRAAAEVPVLVGVDVERLAAAAGRGRRRWLPGRHPGHAGARHGRWQLVARQVVPQRHLPLALLRPLPQPVGTWCTMAICGSRMKSRAYRSRQKAAGA